MKKLDQYLLLKFWSILGLSIIGFISIFIIVDLIENIDRFIDNHVPFKIILKYYFYTIPWFINIGLPMSVLISTIFSLGTIISNATAISELQNQLNVMFNSTYRTTAKNAASSALYREVDLSSLTDGARDNVNTQINTVFAEGKITEHQANTFKINMGLATTTSETFSGTPTEYKIFSNVTFEGTVNCNGFKFTRDVNANSNCNITLKGDSKLLEYK